MPRRSTVLALVLACSLAGCLGGKKLSDIGEPTAAPTGPAWTIPIGVEATPGASLISAIDGLYPSPQRGDKTCCWIGTHAVLETQKAAPASRLDVTLYIPDYAFFARQPQSLELALDGGARVIRCCYAPGVHTVDVDVPPARRSFVGVLPLRIDARFAFVPAEQHVNADTRALGAIVLRVDYH